MSKYIGRFAAPLALGTALLLGACKSDNGKQDTSALASDSALNRDLAMAGRDTTAQPQLKDVPNTPAANAPASSRPAASRPSSSRPSTPAKPRTTSSGNVVTRGSGGGGAVGTIAAGTELSLRPTSDVCTNTNHVGDKITTTVQNAVTGSNGAVIPAGATVTLTVTGLKRSENSRDAIVMEFAVNSVTFGGKTYPLDATMQSASIDRVRNQPASKDAQKVAIGAAAGAIAGKILGKSTKSTVIGGAVGAAAGAATAAATANYEGCVRSSGTIVVKLNAPAQVRV
ncbi:MAG TPA: hypothetical protein VJU87_05905 [Gemmatimonadaceae bacterium]|nr:hypothetical protein [Gemmatimonadaceae bacterium]